MAEKALKVRKEAEGTTLKSDKEVYFFIKKSDDPEKLCEKAEKLVEKAGKASDAKKKQKYGAKAFGLYEKAGNLYQDKGDLENAAKTYSKVGGLCENAKGMFGAEFNDNQFFAGGIYGAVEWCKYAGQLYEKNKSFEKAAEMYLKVAALEPALKADFTLPYYSYSKAAAEMYVKAGKFDKAAEIYLIFAGQSLDPESESDYFTLAAGNYMKMEMYEKAAECYEKAGAGEWKTIETYKSLGLAYEKSGNLQKAAENYVKGYEHTKAAELYVELYGEQGNLQLAAEQYSIARDYSKAGELYLELDDTKSAALQYFKAALNADSIELQAQHYAKAGGLYEKLENSTQAAFCYDKAAALSEPLLKEEYAAKATLLNAALQAAPSDIYIEYKDFTPEMVAELAAVEKAGTALQEFIMARTSLLQDGLYWGPNLDGCFWYRMAHEEIPYSLDKDKLAMLGLKEKAPYDIQDIDALLKVAYLGTLLNIPFPETDVSLLSGDFPHLKNKALQTEMKSYLSDKKTTFASNSEINLLYQLNVSARYSAAEGRNLNFMLKHFPGGNSYVEATHGENVSYAVSLQELLGGFAKPFSDAIGNPEINVSAIMVGHTRFPIAEKELSEKYEIPSLFPAGTVLPSSLSPYLARGLLRNEMGFEGIISPDSYNMSAAAIDSSLLPPELQKCDYFVQRGICAIYAGINFHLGSSKEISVPIKELYSGDGEFNKEFKKVFDDYALESLVLLMKNILPENRKSIPEDDRPPSWGAEGISLEEIYSGKLSGKLQILKDWLDEGGFDRKFMVSNAGSDFYKAYDKPYEHGGDLWNRGGIMDMVFRVAIVEELSGLKFKTLADFGGDTKAEDDWFTYLFADKDFTDNYNKINWNGTEMRSVFNYYYKSLTSYEDEDLKAK